MKKLSLKMLSIAVTTAVASMTPWASVHAAAFGLTEQSASLIGTAGASTAAAEDAATVWLNPAGMSFIGKKQLVVGAAGIYVDGEYSDNGSTPPRNRAANNNGGNLGGLGVVPAFYYMQPITADIMTGIAVNSPFGLKTQYNDDWVGRYQGIKSDIKSINFNPNVSLKLNSDTSVAAGVSAQYFQAELTQAVVFGTSTLPDGNGTIKGDSWGFGYNLAVMHQLTPSTRIGATYRSSILQELEGTVKFTGAALSQSQAIRTAFSDGDLKSDVRLPASLSLSGMHKLNPTWNLVSDLTWTQWSTIQQLNFQRTSPAAGNGVQAIPVAEYRWKDVYRLSLGAINQCNDKVTVRMGVAYDQSPVQTEYRTVRLPDNDRIWLSLGSSYKLDNNNRIDVGAAYIKIKNANINRTEGSSTAPDTVNTVNGSVKGQALVLSTQYVVNF